MPRRMSLRTVTIASVVCAVAVATGCSTTESSAEEAESVSADEVTWPQKRKKESRDLTPTSVDPETVLIERATVMTAAGRKLTPGWVLLRDGRIAEVSDEPIEAPEGAKVVDGRDRYVTPGIVDSHSHMGVYSVPSVRAHADGNEMTDPTTPGVDAADAIWPQDPAFQRAVAGGATTVHVLPGSANVVGGRTVTLELHPGVSTRAMVFEEAPRGMKMACGENPKTVYGRQNRKPSTRMGTVEMLRSTFQSAVEKRREYRRYRKKLAEWKSTPEEERDQRPSPPSRDFGTENLMRVLDGEYLLHVHCYRADDMVRWLEVADEFDFEIRSFHHATEAYKIRDLLEEWEVSVSTWADWWGFKMEAHDAVPENAGLVEVAGGRAVIHSDSSYGVQRLNQEAAKAFYEARHAGLDITENEALRWITANAAWTLGILDETGTLEEGKRADVVLWSDHPFSVYTRAEKVWVEGVREYDRSEDPKPWSDFELGQQPSADEVAP